MILVGWFPFLVIPNANAKADVLTIDFNDLESGVYIGSHYYVTFGCNFSGAVVRNETSSYLAHSPPNLAMSSDAEGTHSAIRVDFNPAMRVLLVGAWFTTGVLDISQNNITLRAYDASNNLVGETPGINSGYHDGLKPNRPVYAEVGCSTGTAISYVVFSDGGEYWGMDDFTFTFEWASLPFDFSISVSPTSGTIQQGSSGTATVSITLVSGTSQSVKLSASDQPSGVAIDFDLISGNPPFSSTMSILVDSSTAIGAYTITITGSDGGKTHTCTYTLTVTAALFDFSISVDPASGAIQQGSSGTAAVSITLTSGSPQSVSLSAIGQPLDVTVSFDPSSGDPSYSSTMSISVGSSVTTTSYDITITGSGGGETQSCIYTLSVTAVDTVPPEAMMSFDPDIRRIVVEGVDDSGGPVDVKSEVVSQDKHANVTRYVLTDAAGNTMEIVIRSVSSSNFVSIEVIQVSYNIGESINPPRNRFTVIYGFDRKTGKLKHIAELIHVKGEFGIEALYNVKMDKTWIFIHWKGEKPTMDTKQGLVLLSLVTKRGSLICPEAVL